MRIPNIISKIFRAGIWLLVSLGAVILLIIGLLQLAAVQNRLTGEIEKYLSDRLKTEVRVGSIGLDFPKMLAIDEIYLETPAGDSLFSLGKFAVDINMLRLFQKEVVIQKVKIEELFAHVTITDSTSNIQFLLDAFVPTDTSGTSAEPPSGTESESAGWAIKFPRTTLELNGADLHYQDDPNGLVVDGTLKTFLLKTDRIDLSRQIYAIREINLSNGQVALVSKVPTKAVDTTAAAAATSMQISSRKLSISKSAFSMQSESMELALNIFETQLDRAELLLREDIQFKADNFLVQDGRVVMDRPAAPRSPGFDPNHLDLRQIDIQAKDMQYTADSIIAQIDRMQTRTSDGLALEELSGRVNYQPDQIHLKEFSLKTARSSIDIPNIAVHYNFQSEFNAGSSLEVNTAAKATIAVSDILYFAPQLDTVDLLQQNRDQRIVLDLIALGDQELLNLDRLYLDGPGFRLRGAGQIRHIFKQEDLAGNFQLDELTAIPSGIVPLFPDSLLPSYISWPQLLKVNGDLNYREKLADFRLRAVEQRDSSPINSMLTMSGQIRDLQQYPATVIDLTIDTLRTTRYSALAYLPENAIPEGYHLPDFLKGSGSIQGPLSTLDVRIQLGTESERTLLAADGQIRDLLKSDSLSFDLRIPRLIVDIPELREILPDSTLPTDLNLPDFRITGGKVNGNIRDINFELPISTINGEGSINGRYAVDRFSLAAAIEGFQPEKLFQGARADSLALLALAPLRLKLDASGQLDPALAAELDLTISEGTKGELLRLEGTAQGDIFSGEMTFSHSDLQGFASARFVRHDSLPEVKGRIQIRRADLERWRLSDRPLYLSGRGNFSSKGLQLNDLSAQLGLNDILLRSDTASAFVDTLFAYAEMHQGNNEVEIFSDLLNFSMEGRFRPALVFGEINRFLQGYWREKLPQPDPVVYGNYLRMYLEIRNPDPLTSGIIPGLRELAPMSATLLYREKEPEFVVTAGVPLLNYAGIKMDSLQLDTRGNTEQLRYQADWNNINLFDQLILGRTQIAGGNTENALKVTFQVWNEMGAPRHRISMEVDPEPDSISIQLAANQLIDSINWIIPADNKLLLMGQRIEARNWQLSYQDQKISIRTPGPKSVVLDLETIRLKPFSRLIRSEEEVIDGVMDGSVKVNDPLGQIKFDAQLAVDGLAVYTKPWGDLSLDIANEKEQIYRLGLRLEEADNDVSLAGTFVPDGDLNLQLDIGALQLPSVEPLSMGYLSNTEGYVNGRLTIGGTFSQPSYQGQLQLSDASLDVDLLKTRFRIENQPIRFSGQTISINNLRFFDPQNNEATLKGKITARSLSNYQFDLSVSARDFLILNTNKEDNPLYYGYLRTDADVKISGDIYEPVLKVTASPKENSNLTYNMSQTTVPQTESRAGVLRFVERYEWQQTMIADSLQQQQSGSGRGFDLTTNLNVNPGLKFTVVIDPVTGDQFSGRGEGDIVFRQFADGKMEMTGRIEMIEGLYDFTYQGLISRQFTVEPGSSINWQGDPMNPGLDLSISSYIQAVPYPLVSEFNGEAGGNLRRQQTFAVRMNLKGTLESMEVNTNILYPEDIPGNSGLPSIEQSLTTLRTDQSQLNTQAFGLLLFKGFVNFGDNGTSSGGSIDNSVQSGLDNVLTQQLNNLANRYINFVELDFGMESFDTGQGGRQRDLRLSLRKRLFNNRLIISVDGVTQTGETDADNTLPQTYLDNLTAELLLSKNGRLRLKIFSNRELDQFTTGDVVRIGGHLAFSKDFNRFFWSSDKRPAKDPAGKQQPENDAGRNGEQKIEIQEE